MARRFFDKKTGEPMTRVQIVEAFEKEQGDLSAAQFEHLLIELEYYETFGEWRDA